MLPFTKCWITEMKSLFKKQSSNLLLQTPIIRLLQPQKPQLLFIRKKLHKNQAFTAFCLVITTVVFSEQKLLFLLPIYPCFTAVYHRLFRVEELMRCLCVCRIPMADNT